MSYIIKFECPYFPNTNSFEYLCDWNFFISDKLDIDVKHFDTRKAAKSYFKKISPLITETLIIEEFFI